MHIEQSLKPPEWFAEPLQPRAKGLHVSTVIKAFAERIGEGKTAAGWQTESLFEMGLMWEEMVGRVLTIRARRKDGVEAPKPKKVNGIWVSPDFIKGDSIVECKATWRTIRDFNLDREWAWLMQVQSYCYAHKKTKVRLPVLFINGDYKYKELGGPRVIDFVITFKQREIDTKWAQIVDFARKQKLL